MANVLNVKAASIYLSLAPQFIPQTAVGMAPMLLLAAVHAVTMAVWLGLWSTGVARVSARFDRRRWARRMDAVGGAVLVALGVRTAAQTR